MSATFTATTSLELSAPPAKVWEALTNPAMVKQYMFGAELTGDWLEGGTVTYRGEWDGTPFEDKGDIVEIDPPRLLRVNYYSAMSGQPDTPENRQLITYELQPAGSGTRLTVSQAGNPSQEAATAAEGNWAMTLDTLKALLV
ncbi:hypothetical protein VW23_027110 [Devosia insulae DS-56]|uniref:Activator of Hsp90 ATPase homologue 1/2-like C-terminal domain-containing protein n=1 Tax=Devosia insulae DS-56 TaxID=1116389 RepID=A0A1E5XKK5_9HYPH|nr:SRPBCC family protein [Devosia insulae]OEO29102.1 hypothetical protein VW23_027110 [Devosia insulae DS-56]